MVLQKTPLTSSPAHAQVPVPVPVAAKTAAPSKKSASAFGFASAPFWIGLGVSVTWTAIVFAVISRSGSTSMLAGVPLVDWAMGISAVVSPIAMVWMIAAYMQRASDIQSITDPLRRQLTLITGESGAADARIRRFNQAIREQIDLLRNAQSLSQEDMESTLDRVAQHRADLEHLESISGQQVKDIQDVVRRSMFQVEQMMDDKFTMLRVLDGKLQQNGEGLLGKIENIGDTVARVLQSVEDSSSQISTALDQSLRDSQKLSETSHLQESSLTNAAKAASEMLGGLSSKIDLSVAKFLERAAVAREEAERLAHALDAQTRALDDFTATLPVRVSDAESILRGVADRLYASEQMAREQAVNLSDKLHEQVDGLQQCLDSFVSRLSEVDTKFNGRREDLDKLVERIGGTTSGFFSSWEKSVEDLNDKMGNSLLRFTVVNDETRRNADGVMTRLDETTGKYEEAATRIRTVSDDTSEKLKGMSEELTKQLAQFDKLSAASNKAGQEVQDRAATALSNLQSVLERVLTARDATSTIGQTLVKDIGDAVAQNEKMIQRLTEAAQAGARAVGMASDGLGTQESDLMGKAKASEAVFKESVQRLQSEAETASKVLREQTANLMNLLAEAQGQLIATDQKLQSFALQAVVPVQTAMEQIDSSADHSLQALGSFNEGLSLQVERLRDFHSRISDMSEQVGKTTADSAAVFETLTTKFSASSVAQEESARRILSQFTGMADRMQGEVTGLDKQAATALELLQQAAMMVGEQSCQMMEKAKTSEAQIKDVTSHLQNEATQIQTLLKQQADEIGDDLALAERRFGALGELLREKAAATNEALDTTAAHYTDIAQKLDETVGSAQGKVETLHAALSRQVEQLGADAAVIERHATGIASGSEKTIENLATLRARMSEANERVLETTATFEKRAASLTEAANTASVAVTKSSEAFDAQATRLVEGGRQIASILDLMTGNADSLSEKATGIRLSMEQENGRLLMQLTDSLTQLDSMGEGLRQMVVAASQGADQVKARFVDMNEAATGAQASLSKLGADVTQQSSTLAVIGEQITEQQKLQYEANEKQRAQMLDLFEKLNVAHTHTSEIAVRSITSLASSLKEIDRQMNEVDTRSVTAAGNVKAASATFSDQCVLLVQNAQAAEQQARNVLKVSSSLQEEASSLSERIRSESGQVTESFSALLNRLSAGGDEIRNLGSGTETALSSLQRSMATQATELDGAMAQISERQRVLTTALDAQRETMNALLNRLTVAQDLTASTAENAVVRLSEGAQKIAKSAETIDACAKNAIGSVQNAVTGFNKETETVEKKARQVTQDARQILSSASEVREQVDVVREAMRAQGDAANTVLTSLLEKVKTGTADLREISESTGQSIIALNSNVEKQTAALTASMTSIAERQTSLLSALAAQREAADSLLSRLVKAQEDTATSAERGAIRLVESAGRIEHHIEVIDSRSQKAIISVKAATEAFAKEAEEIDRQAKDAEEKAHGILASASTLSGQIGAMRKTMETDGGLATEALDCLLTRITAGGSELREVGSSTEKTLAALQQSLEKKTSELNATMKQIGDRQDTLAKALDAQRETISNLLTRFTQAQEETVVVAERTASRLNEEAHSITNSIDMIGAQASTTLGNVQSAVSAFAEQSVAIKLHSQQAEQQVKGMMSATSGMQERAEQLRSVIESESTKVAKLLSGVIEQLETAGSQFKTQSGDASKAIETAKGQIKTASEFGDKANAQAQKLANAAEFATTRLVALRDSLVAADKTGVDAVQKVSGRIGELKSALEAQLGALADLSKKSVDQVAEASKKLSAESATLRANLASSESAMSETASMLREEGKQLPTVLARGTKTVEAAAKVLKEKAAEADQSLIGTADRFITATAGARTNMAEEMKRVGTTAEEASNVLKGFNQLLAEQVAAIQKGASMLSSEQREIVERAGLGVQALEEASKRLLSVRNEASQTAEKLVREFGNLDQRAASMGAKLTQTGEGVAKQIEAIASATKDAEDRLSGAGETLRDQLDRIQGGMQGQIDEINHGLLQIMAQLERTGVNLRSTAVGAVADVERVGQRFEQTGSAAAAQVKEETDRMQKATDEVADMLANFGERFDRMIEHMAKAGVEIKSQEGDSIERLQRMVGHLAAISEKLETARTMSGALSQNTIEILDEVVTAVQAQMNKLTSGAQTAAGVMRGINQIYNDQTANLNKGVGEAHNQVVSMNKSIDEMQQRTDRMRTALKDQGDELMSSLRQILAQLEMTGDGLTDAVNSTLREQAAVGLKKLS
ncbi:MAG: hypothetical protein PHW76_04770 [Alphaproteobacteria bacterium]|nr:hypothetical protein [Alphaproteobacteria bacterium]